MKYTYASLFMIMLGLIGFAIVMVFQFVTINNESDYYSLKEAMEASMYESVDKAYYMETGEIKIVQEKFVENFTKRFIKNTMGNSIDYVLEFYDIMELPPKASVVIKNKTSSMSLSENNFTVVNNLTGILEANLVPEELKSSTEKEDIIYNICEDIETKVLPSSGTVEVWLNGSSKSGGNGTKELKLTKDNVISNYISSINYISVDGDGGSCESQYLSYNINSTNNGGINIEVSSNDPNFERCNVIFKYDVNLTYSYCNS